MNKNCENSTNAIFKVRNISLMKFARVFAKQMSIYFITTLLAFQKQVSTQDYDACHYYDSNNFNIFQSCKDFIKLQ